MTVEQAPEHNRFVDNSIPLTWGFWWQHLKMMLPIWLFIWACLLEMGILKAWFAGRLNFDFVVTLVAACLFLLVFIFGMVRIQIWFLHRTKRVFCVKDRGVSLSPARSQFHRWKQVAKFQFEPLPELSGASKLNLFLAGAAPGKSGAKPAWAMVLANPLLVEKLIGCLQTKRSDLATAFEIEILDRPSPSEQPVPFSYLGTSLYFAGMYFLLHGIPLLILWFTRGRSKSTEATTISSEASERLGQLISNHFSSVEELDRFVLALGVVLSVVGVILLLLGWRLVRIGKLSQPNQVDAMHSRKS
jgi:hypothetical protein